jgi:hypothetical protein
MKRTGFKPAWTPRPVKRMDDYTVKPKQPARPARPAAQMAQEVLPRPKECVLDHEGYMDVVRAMPCFRCGRHGPSQFCHSDEGKGMGIKTDCRRGWPGCAACHELVGSSGKLGKQGRRLFEVVAALATRTRVIEQGLWPATLPEWRPTGGTDGQGETQDEDRLQQVAAEAGPRLSIP